jgi:pimeloyl-ACP methyl ester carboxylesterase
MAYKTRFVTSADGAAICFRECGAGPGLVLVHGGMQAAQNFSRLTEALGDTFTVYVPDRRGRGRSGRGSERYGLLAEVAAREAHSTERHRSHRR